MLEESRRSNRIAIAAVLITALSVALTVLIKTIVALSGTTERVIAVEKSVEKLSQEIDVMQADIKQLLGAKK